MDEKTQEQIHHLALSMCNDGPIAQAVRAHARCTGSAAAPCDMMLAQRILSELIARYDIPCSARLTLANAVVSNTGANTST